jgi:hypothetical protein
MFDLPPSERAMIRVETSFQDTPGDGYYSVLLYKGKPLAEQLDELDLRDGDRVMLWEEDCDLEFEAILCVDYQHPMTFEKSLWAKPEPLTASDLNQRDA